MNIIDKNIFESDATLILIPADCTGVMENDIAKEVKEKFPRVFSYYKSICNGYKRNNAEKDLLGKAQIVSAYEAWQIDKPEDSCLKIANLFFLKKYGDEQKYIDYMALRKCLEEVKKECKDDIIAVPYNMGCIKFSENWNTVWKMIEEILNGCNVTIYRYNSKQN